MNQGRPVRVMWLLNHTAARRFEIPMLKAIGVNEFFLPKCYPNHPSFRSASVDWSEDGNLTIPPGDLAILNAADWYGGADKAAWEIADRHFDVVFLVLTLHSPDVLRNASKYFCGIVVWRVYGQHGSKSYSSVLDGLSGGHGAAWLKRLGSRFVFGEAYSHLAEIEPPMVRRRQIFLPLGLGDAKIKSGWNGTIKKVLFVCPDIAFNSYYESTYRQFVADFHGIPYVIGGTQPIHVNDPNVLGFLPHEAHEKNMRDMRVMFYHSAEPNHIHYHPFEAIRVGMPLVFMGGGILDRFGGVNMPGRCKTLKEAREKIERILNDDWELIEDIRKSQVSLLEPMKAENCEPAWRDGFRRILADLEASRAEQLQRPAKRKRIAVIVPYAYRGGSLLGAKLLAQALYQGSRHFDEAADIVFFHLDEEGTYAGETFEDLFPGVSRRTFKWEKLKPDVARRAMRYAGYETWEPAFEKYLVPEDGINQLLDCDLWLFVSDRLAGPLLPLRPCVLLVFDYLQRYFPQVIAESDQFYLAAARQAERVLVTTDFTRNDALQYAGLPPNKVVKLPILAPLLDGAEHSPPTESDYFVWTTNLAQHKNHANAFKALRWYYEELGGRMDCIVTGVHTESFFEDPLPHLAEAKALLKGSEVLRNRMRWQGELARKDYQRTLAGAAFLWHAGRVDNGTFSVIEAASLGVPALSSDYPAMREIDQQFALNLAWMDADQPKAMAEQLKQMELTYHARQGSLPSKAQLAEQSPEKLAGEYWKVIRECL